jgi:hypothetical protein
MPASPAQIARNRIGGTLRQNPDADVTELRRDMEAAKLAGHVEEWIETWAPTPEQVDVIIRILDPDGR